MEIITATNDSLSEIISVINDSIMNLCTQDHLNKKEHLKEWLIERSEGNLKKQLFHDNSHTFVCVDNEKIVGISQIEKTGALKLCYVHSQNIGKGIGRMLLEAAENQAKEWGLNQITMVSTRTARDFYLSQGYSTNGEIVECIGMPGYPLVKNI